MLQRDKVELSIAGRAHDKWESYEIDSDLLTPADGWQLTLGMSDGEIPAGVVPGAPVVLKIGGETVLTGRLDEIDHHVGKTAHTLTLSGRDKAADLLDCSAPVFVGKMIGLKEIADKILTPFGIKPRIGADSTRTREKINIEPGDTAWDALAHAAEANGLWPWFEPDGTLVIGGPDYSTPIAATLILRKNGKGNDGRRNNVLSLSKQESVHGRYSKVTVLGQMHGTDLEQGGHNLRGSWEDNGVNWHRPKIVTDHECDSTAVCRDRARKILNDSRLNALTLSALVQGHRIVEPGRPADGWLWKPGQRVHVISEPHEIEANFFLMGRKFRRNRADGTRTALTLKEDGMWLLDAHPHKNQHRKGKNSVPGKIIEVAK